MATKFGVEWFETSAKTGFGVEKTFGYLASEISNRYEKEIESMKKISLSDSGNKKKGGCC